MIYTVRFPHSFVFDFGSLFDTLLYWLFYRRWFNLTAISINMFL